MQPTKVKAVIFDVYGTLLNPFALEQQAQQVAADGAQFMSLWRSKQLEYSWLLSLMGRYESFWQITQRALVHTCEKLKVNLTTTQIQTLLDGWTTVAPFEDVAAGLAKLQAKNIRLGVLSNGNPEMLEAGLSNAGIRDKLELVLSVQEAGVYKPSPLVYQLAVQHLKADQRSQIGFVSSNSWDAIGAAAFGFQVCWLNRAGNVLDELGVTPAYQVASFGEVVEVFDAD